MSNEIKITSRNVWSKSIRLAHWLLAASTLSLMFSGWLMTNTPSMAQIASEYHHLIAAFFAVSLGFRLLLLFTESGAGKASNMLKSWPDLNHIKTMVLFYLTFGRSDLPKWFSHNLSWMPLYFLLFVMLVLQTLSGVMMIYDWYPMNIYPPELHDLLASLITWWFLFHLYAVVLHDLKGKQADISAMINGKRYFELNLQKKENKASASFTIDVSEITKKS